MLLALATKYSYSFGEGFANGDATRFLDAKGFTRLHRQNLPPQVTNPRVSVVRVGGLRFSSRGFNRQTLFKQPLTKTLNALLITGTDTDAGKTVLTTALAAYWQTYGSAQTLGILKPIQTGGDGLDGQAEGDRALYSRLFELDQNEVTPLHFKAPLAPPLAAAQEGRRIELDKLWQSFEVMRQNYDWVLVEGLGGLGSPLTNETTVADLAWDWHLPTVLVVPVKLGAIGQAVANVALARQTRVHLRGIVLNCVQPCSEQEITNWAPADLIRSLTNIPILGLIPYLPDPTNLNALAYAASNLDLEHLLPLAKLLRTSRV